jgi:hypothetical protein
MLALAVTVCVLAAFLLKAPQVLAPMGQDQGLYHAVGAAILDGAVPYRDAWDPKPPGIFYAHAGLLALLGPDPWRLCPVGGLEPRCGTLLFGVVDFLLTLGLGGLVALIARRLGLPNGSQVLAFGLTILAASLVVLDPEGSTPEKWALVPATAVIVAALRAVHPHRRRWLIVAGLCGAVAAILKPPDLASVLAVSGYMIWRRQARDLAWVWGPLLLVLLGTWAVFALQGAGGALLEATLGYNVARAGFEPGRIPQAAGAATWQLARAGLVVVWLPALVGAAIAWSSPPRWRLILLWALLDIAALFLGGTKFTRTYFIQLVPSMALLATLGLTGLWSGLGSRLARGLLGVGFGGLILLTGGFQLGFMQRVWNESVAHGPTTYSIEQLAALVRGLPADETVFVWGDEAQLYALAERLPPGPFLNLAGLASTGDPAAAARRTELLTRLQRDPPAVIVVDRRTADDDPDGRLGLNTRFVPELTALLATRYRPMADDVLGGLPGGDREQVFIRHGGPDLCALMAGCRLA